MNARSDIPRTDHPLTHLESLGWACIPLRKPLTASALALAWVLAGCGPVASSGPSNQNGPQGRPDAAVPTDGTVEPDRGPTAWPDASPNQDAELCGEQTEDIELINLGDPPDMLIVLDRSGSMMMPPGLTPGASKWSLMKSALDQVAQARESNIRFGLLWFPSDDACGVDPTPEVPVDLNNASAIHRAMNSTSPNGNTPAHLALQAALDYYRSIPVNDAGRYVLFATDGVPNCGGDPPSDQVETKDETLQAVRDLAAEGIHTFVLGFGGIISLDPDLLNDCAQAGLEPRPNGPPYFYHAEDAASLQAALDAIAGGIIVPSCSYALASQPPEPDNVTVLFDGTPVPRNPSHQNGWDYDPDQSTITFYGSYCDEIQSGQVDEVRFLFGCPGPVVE